MHDLAVKIEVETVAFHVGIDPQAHRHVDDLQQDESGDG
jgi:hypothetical protein